MNQQQPANDAHSAYDSGQPRNILVVDDDPVIRDMMVDILELEGYAIQLARNGLEALDILRGNESYLVFLDLMMPVLNGKELCEILDVEPELRARHTIVLMSAMDKMDEASMLNVDALMPKPFSVDDVVRMLTV
ncbi:MAG: response regulator transcription factor [Ktedonobacteraceae bacterium]